MQQFSQNKNHQGAPEVTSSPHPVSKRQVLSPFAMDAIQRKDVNRATLCPTDVAILQRSIGNRRIQHLLNPTSDVSVTPFVQPKLKVGPANDLYEQEADRVARQVINGSGHSAPTRVIQRKPTVQREMLNGFQADSNFESKLSRTEGSGKPLSEKTRAEFEPKFGASFDNVRIHTNSSSNQLNRSIQARAFTHGNDIHFGAGAYNPTSSDGKRLLAHELTHTIQQTGGGNVQRRSAVTPAPISASNLTIQRKLNFTEEELQGSLTKTAIVKGFFGKESTFAKIRRELADYQNADGPAEELMALTFLKELTSQWLATHGTEKGKDAVKESSIKKLAAEIDSEIPIVNQKIVDDSAEQDEYIRKVQAKSLKYMSSGGHMIAKNIKGWHSGTDQVGARAVNVHQLSKTHNLTLAEASAVGIYTADDYKYMNPAMAKDRSWMKTMLPRVGYSKHGTVDEVGKGVSDTHIDEAMEEGQLHGKIAKSGMKKLPNWIGTTFRGLALTEEQFAIQYPMNSTTTFSAFSSTSKNVATSRGFARNEATNGKVAILLQLRLTKGKDIAALSNSPGESEILLMPGAAFRVSKIKEEQYKGIKMYVVDLKQEK